MGIRVHCRNLRMTSRPSISGETEIEQDDIGIPCRRFGQTFSASRGFIVTEAVLRQRRAKEAANLWLVFNHEDDRGGFDHLQFAAGACGIVSSDWISG
jgi:hypothetical protein